MASEQRNAVMGWTQNPEPPISEQTFIFYPLHSEEPISLSDFLEALSTNHHGSFHYYAEEDQLQPIQTIEEIPTTRSFLVKHSFYITRRQLCDRRIQERGGWNSSCLVTNTTEHTGYLMFYQTGSFHAYNEYACIYTYYDGTFGNHRRISYIQEHIRATNDELGVLIDHGKLWINPTPIQAQFPLSNSQVLEKTRRHRIPVIEIDQELHMPIIHTN